MIPNLIIFTGQDDFRMRERIKLLKEKFREKYPDGEIKTFETQAEINEIDNATSTPNLFGGKRLIFTEEFWDAENFEKAEKIKFFSRLQTNEDIATLIAIEPKLDKRLKSTKFLLDNGKIENFEPLDEIGLLQWIQKKAEENQKKITNESARYLLSRCGTNLWNLSREIEKLSIATKNEAIEKELIDELTIANPEAIIWEFVELLSKKNAKKAIEKFHDLLSSGSSIHEIFPMICREIRIHAILRAGIDKKMSAGEIAKEVGLHPFVVQKTISLTKNFSKAQIQKMYDDLFEIDKKLKTGKIYTSSDDTGEFELAIEKFILNMSQ